jgi:hypothetical protein
MNHDSGSEVQSRNLESHLRVCRPAASSVEDGNALPWFANFVELQFREQFRYYQPVFSLSLGTHPVPMQTRPATNPFHFTHFILIHLLPTFQTADARVPVRSRTSGPRFISLLRLRRLALAVQFIQHLLQLSSTSLWSLG